MHGLIYGTTHFLHLPQATRQCRQETGQAGAEHSGGIEMGVFFRCYSAQSALYQSDEKFSVCAIGLPESTRFSRQKAVLQLFSFTNQ